MFIPVYKEKSDWYNQCVKYGVTVAEMYANDMEWVKKRLIENRPYRYCLLSVYTELCKDGELERVETLDQETQLGIIGQREKWSLNIPQEIKEPIDRCIWVLGYLLEKYFV